MSVKVMAWVWDQEVPRNQKFVLLAYADHADHDGKNVYPAVDTIAKKTGYHRRQVQRITAELETDGWMIPDGQGPKGTNKWRIPLSTRDDKMSPLAAKGVASGAYGGDISANGGVTPAPPEPSSLTIKDSSEEDERKKLIKTWESSASGITPGIAEDLYSLADEVEEHIQQMPPGLKGGDLSGTGWIIHAIKTARKSASGKFNTKYVQAIVDRWIRDGFDSPFARDKSEDYKAGVGEGFWDD